MLSPEFYDQPTIEVAQQLLGKVLVHETQQGILSGRIVETEAYVSGDPASHAYKGISKRNQAMFGPPGRVYIYLIYGMYYCLNIVTAAAGVGEAVLLRALEPLKGTDVMQRNRGVADTRLLCNGPAKLVSALAIDTSYAGHDLTQAPLYITDSGTGVLPPTSIGVSTRIGITQGADLPLRFYIKDSDYLSR